MMTSLSHAAEPTEHDPASIATRLLGAPADRVIGLGESGNSRVYRVEAGARRYLLKSYPSPELDGRDRLGQEYAALSFLNAQGLAGAVAQPLAQDRDRGFGLFTWLDGVKIGPHTPDDIDQMVAFVARLHRLSTTEAALRLPTATESSLSAQELLRQVDARLERLRSVAIEEPALARFLELRLAPALAAARSRLIAGYDAVGLRPELALSQAQKVLSPSDFGFHNCLRRANGSLVFVDFEYFGWDDPVRLVGDFICHPAMTLSESDRRRFITGTAGFFEQDPGYRHRLRAQVPLIALRWCLILLNEFLPRHWRHRMRAGTQATWNEAKTRQLGKAESMLDHHETILCSEIT